MTNNLADQVVDGDAEALVYGLEEYWRKEVDACAERVDESDDAPDTIYKKGRLHQARVTYIVVSEVAKALRRQEND